MRSQTFRSERKVSALLKSAPFVKNSQTRCQLLGSRAQTLRKLKISRTLWTCACAFSSLCPALMLDYTPSVAPLPPLKYGSDDRKRPAASMGAAAHGEVDESRERGWGGDGEAEGFHVSLWAILDVCGSKEWVERCGGYTGGGGVGGASEGLEIVGVFQRRTPRKASISSGVRMAPPLASHGAWTPRLPGIHAENTI